MSATEPLAERPGGEELRTRMRTVRPGRSAPALLVPAAMLAAFLLWAAPRLDEARARWDGGDPVLLTVTGVVDDDVLLKEWGGRRIWTVDEAEVPEPVMGARVQARVGGDCRCELVLERPGPLPWWIRALPFVLGILGVRAVVAGWRWRSVGPVLARPARPVRVTPTWVRSGIGPSPLAVRIHDESPGGRDGWLLELAGTFLDWVPSPDETVLLYGPHPSTGVTVIEGPSGRAVPSSALISPETAARRVRGWSDHLSRLLLPEQDPEEPLAIGGSARERVSVSTAGSSAGAAASGQALLHDPRWFLRWYYLYPMAAFLGTVLFGWFRGWTGGWLILATVTAFVAVRVVFDRLVKASAGRPPFAGWDDRTAARQAAEAAVMFGYLTPRRSRPR